MVKLSERSPEQDEQLAVFVVSIQYFLYSLGYIGSLTETVVSLCAHLRSLPDNDATGEADFLATLLQATFVIGREIICQRCHTFWSGSQARFFAKARQ